MQGHVFQPLMAYLEEIEGMELHKHWTARSRCMPDLAKEEKRIEETPGKLETRVEKAMERMGRGLQGKEGGLKGTWAKAQIRAAGAAIKRKHPGMIRVEQVKEVKEKMEGVIIAPLDKAQGELMMV